MKCDGLPDPVCVRELNTYLSLWQEDDSREDIDQVLERTQVRTRTGPQEYYGFCKLENKIMFQEVLPIMTTLENLIENPDEWEVCKYVIGI